MPEIFEQPTHIAFQGSHPVFRDHFPGSPIVPAFMQLEVVRDYAARLLERAVERVEVRSVKFVRPLLPDCQASLRFQFGSKSETLSFEILVDSDVITHGDIRLG